MATSSPDTWPPDAGRQWPRLVSTGVLLDGETWTGTDTFTRPGLPTVHLKPPTTPHPLPSASSRLARNAHGAEFHRVTGTLVGLEAEARRTDANYDDLLKLREHELKVQDQRDRRSMQGAVLLAIIGVIVMTLVLVVVTVGVKWITEGFGEHIISLVLTAALSGLGGAVAWAFRGTAPGHASPTHPSRGPDHST